MRSDPIKEMNEYMEKCLSIHSFSFYEPRILERKQWIQSKINGPLAAELKFREYTVPLARVRSLSPSNYDIYEIEWSYLKNLFYLS